MLLLKVFFYDSGCFVHEFLEQFVSVHQEHFAQTFIDSKHDMSMIDLEYVLFK